MDGLLPSKKILLLLVTAWELHYIWKILALQSIQNCSELVNFSTALLTILYYSLLLLSTVNEYAMSVSIGVNSMFSLSFLFLLLRVHCTGI